MQHERHEERVDGRPAGAQPSVEHVPGLRGQEAIDTDAVMDVAQAEVRPVGPVVGGDASALDSPAAAPRPTQLNPRP